MLDSFYKPILNQPLFKHTMKTSVENKQSHLHFKLIPLKKVLIALDYDPSAQKIAETGFSFAKTMSAEVILLHVVGELVYYSSLEYSPIMGFSGFNSGEMLHLIDNERVKIASKDFLDKTKHHLGDETIKTIVEEGDAADVIIKVAKHVHADVIVMGSHSRRWLEQILLGSVAEKVLHHSMIPLFIIPTKGNKSK